LGLKVQTLEALSLVVQIWKTICGIPTLTKRYDSEHEEVKDLTSLWHEITIGLETGDLHHKNAIGSKSWHPFLNQPRLTIIPIEVLNKLTNIF
jgi:hypothetical protein